MDLLEISEKRRLKREDAAQLLHGIADSLARHNVVDFRHSGKTLTVRVPAEVDVEIEVDIESDESSIEIEISW